MPLYEYECPRCGRFEVIRKFSDEPLVACPTCAGEIQKLLSAPAIQFKGKGWYITDYARKATGGEAAGKGSGDGGSSSKDGASSSKDTDTKPAASTESASSKGSAGGTSGSSSGSSSGGGTTT